MARVLDVVIDPKGAVSGAARVRTALTSIGATAKTQLGRLGGSFSNFSNRVVGLNSIIASAGIGAGLKSVVNDAIKFESAFTGVRKTVDLSEQGFQQLEKRFTELSETIPVSREELAGIGELAGQLGVGGVENLQLFTETIAKIAVSTNLTQEKAATDFARFSNIMSEPIENVGALGDVVVDLGNNAATTERDIISMALRLSGAGKSAGLTSSEVLGVASALSSVGLAAQAGGTAFSKIFLKFSKDAAIEGGKFNEVLGLTEKQFKTLFESDPAEAITRFVEALGQMSKTDVLLLLDRLKIKETRLRDAVLRSVNAQGLLRENIDRANKALVNGGALQEEAARRFSTTESALKTLSNTLTNVSGTIGEVLLPGINALVQGLRPALSAVREFSEENPLLTKTLVAVGAAVAVGGILVVGLTALAGLLAPLAGTIGVVAASIVGGAGFVAALVVLREKIVAAGSAIKKFVVDGIEKLKMLPEMALKAGKGFVSAFITGVKSTAVSGLKAITESFIAPIAKLLPGSDAEEGPLRTLTASGRALPETFALGVEQSGDVAVNRVRSVMERVRNELDIGGGGSTDRRILGSQNLIDFGGIDPDRQGGVAGGLDAGLDEFLRKAQDGFSQGVQLSRSTAQEMGNVFGEFFFSVIDTGFTSFKESARSALSSFAQIAKKMIAQLLTIIVLRKAAGFFAGGGAAAGGETAQVAALGNVVPFAGGFAEGGVVPGTGNSDTVSIRATPGEGILSRRGMQAFDAMNNGRVMSSGLVVNIQNNAGSDTKVSARKKQGSRGESLEIVIDKLVAKVVTEGGEASSAFESTFGLSRLGGFR